MATMLRGTYESPIGLLEVRGSEKGILSVRFTEEEHEESDLHEMLQDCFDQLHNYFTTDRHDFHSLALMMNGTDFQVAVWEEVIKIPYGEVQTYGQIAEKINEPKASRAVGSAVGSNPLSLLIPCHRVVPSAGGEGEYAWGAWRKVWLLNHERAVFPSKVEK